jgi:hypothetical protein
MARADEWINQSVASSTGYTPTELMEGKSRPDLFASILRKDPGQLPQEESTEDKALKAYAPLKLKADRRNRQKKQGRHQWDPQVGDLVLAKQQAVSEASVVVRDDRLGTGQWQWADGGSRERAVYRERL